jgi:hypothetical protein
LHFRILSLFDREVTRGEFDRKLAGMLHIPASELKEVHRELRSTHPECYKKKGGLIRPPGGVL